MFNASINTVSTKVYVAILFVSLVIGSFAYFGQAPKQHNSELPTTAESASPSPTPTLSIQSCNKNECVIKELGIKFATPNDLSDLIYVADSRHASFSTKSLMGKNSECAPSLNPLGVLNKISKSELNDSNGNWQYREADLKKLSMPWRNSESEQFNAPKAKELHDFYILYQGPHSVCSSVKAEQELQTKQLQYFMNFSATVEPLL